MDLDDILSGVTYNFDSADKGYSFKEKETTIKSDELMKELDEIGSHTDSTDFIAKD